MRKSTLADRTQQPASLARLEALTNRDFGRRERDHHVYIVLDYSGSMSDGRKMQQAKDGARSFAESAIEKGYTVGLVQFATTPYCARSPKTELHGFKTALDAWEPNGSTDMAAAIRLVIQEFSSLHGTKVLCLITDGQPNDAKATLAAGRTAKAAGIDIMAIGTDDADHAFLAKLTTRHELAVTVRREEFQRAISSMALLLPAPGR